MPPTFSLLAVSDRRAGERLGLSFAAWLDALAAAGLAGVAAVQLREKELDDRALWDLARFARRTLPPAIPLLVNGRLDIALAAGACIGGGVHLPADGVPAAALRRRFANQGRDSLAEAPPPDLPQGGRKKTGACLDLESTADLEAPVQPVANGAFLLPRTRGRPGGGAPAASIADPRPLLIGRSTHSLDEVFAARDEGVDYVTFGPVWETPGKGPPLGTAALARAAAAGVPVYALGGVTLERLGELAAAGAAGAAALRMFQRPAELAGLARAAAQAFARSV